MWFAVPCGLLWLCYFNVYLGLLRWQQDNHMSVLVPVKETGRVWVHVTIHHNKPTHDMQGVHSVGQNLYANSIPLMVVFINR